MLDYSILGFFMSFFFFVHAKTNTNLFVFLFSHLFFFSGLMEGRQSLLLS